MKKLKILTLFGVRPEIIKLSSVIRELDAHTDHVLVHTGQNYDYELNEVFFKDLGLRKPDYFLEAAGTTAVKTVATVMEKLEDVLEKEKPDAFLVLGDTNSTMGAYAAKRHKIPIFHMEAGNRCFDFRVPEEVNRRVIDHISDINLTYSDISRDNLLREGLPIDRTIKTGSPMFEVLAGGMENIHASTILTELKLKPNEYFVFSTHREENVDSPSNLKKIVEITKAISAAYDFPIIFSCHPRTKKRIDDAGFTFPKQVRLMKPFGWNDYMKLQMNACCVLTDSGTISEESSIMNFPALNLREAHERAEAMDEASVVMTGLNPERVMQALAIVKNQSRGEKREFNIPEDYSYPQVSKKVLRIILSYTDYVKRTVWGM